MKITALLLATFLLPIVGPLSATEPWADDYAKLLKQFVSPEGVRYKAWKSDPRAMAVLGRITQQIANAKGPTDTSREGRLAYYANVYNILVLQGVLEAYPIKSVKEIAPLFGFFTGSRFVVSGKKVSLNKIEKEWLLKEFSEPRIHFIINCASLSCPPLPGEPLAANQLENQMEAATRAFVTKNPFGVRIEKDRVEISQIFEWYDKDFKAAGGAVAFINRYRNPPLAKGVKVSFQPYDWSLNGR